jgi:hypothetical protein
LTIEVNYVAVVVAAIVSMVIGFLWYSPMILGKPWMKEKGYTPEALKKEQSKMGKFYALSFVAALVTAYVLTHIITLSKNFYSYPDLQTGLTTAFWLWLGFILPVQLADQIFGEKNWKLLSINTGFQLVSLLAMGVVITLM